jgi:hypothetical protein
MRTKTLLLTAALSLAGIATSSAQVFSANIVGYYNKTVPAGQFALLANQLKNGTNGLSQILSGAADGDLVFVWNGSGYASSLFIAGIGWDPELQVNPGEGFFYRNNGASPATITFVGEVPTGSLTNTLNVGLNLKGAIVPQAGDLDTVHGLQGNDGDVIYKWAGTGWNPQVPIYIVGIGWDPAATVTVGEGFFYRNTGTGTRTWVRTFNP